MISRLHIPYAEDPSQRSLLKKLNTSPCPPPGDGVHYWPSFSVEVGQGQCVGCRCKLGHRLGQYAGGTGPVFGQSAVKTGGEGRPFLHTGAAEMRLTVWAQ